MLKPGTRLGPYEIVSPLGAGAMGQVYRARDTRLGREVALKVLPQEVAADPARRFRFEQEARAAAALNHPNVTGLHDVGEESGVSFIVTELVPGETLEAVLTRGPVPIKRLLDIAVQIADGMACAHSARITHRDLKPANLMVTEEGRVKILDFGLAKQGADASSGVLSDNSATIALNQTEPGMIIGTVQYMSPEQARGKPADYRSDQFSFGIILYEMASGRKAFDRPEAVQIMSAILSDEAPPIDRSIPAPLRWSIERCLAKEPINRYESSRDLYHELKHLRDNLAEFTSSQSGVATVIAPAPELPKTRRKIPWQAVAAFAAGAALAGGTAYVLAGGRSSSEAMLRYTPFSFEPGGQHSPVWSPNGKAVAYAARPMPGTPAQVFVRYLDSPTPVQITKLSESVEPLSWAPDGARIFFRSDREPAGVWSVAAIGGEPEPVMAHPPGGPLAISADAKSVAVLRRGDDPTYGVWVSSPPGAALQRYKPEPFVTPIVYNTPRLRFAPDGKSIILLLNGEKRREEMWLLPYPADPSHPPKQVLPNTPSFGGTPNFTWMPDSKRALLLLNPDAESQHQMWLMDVSSGKRLAVASGTTDFIAASVSPDSSRLIVSEGAGNHDIISVNLETAAVTRTIATERSESMPAWAANTQSLVYVTDRGGAQEIWLRTGDGPSRPLVTARDFPPNTQWFMAPALSPDGTRVVYTRLEHNGGGRLWMSSIAGGAPVPLTNDISGMECPGSFSPDGTWFGYYSIHGSKVDLMKVKVSGQAAPTLVKSGIGGEVPMWSPTGEWLLAGDELISPDGQTVKNLGEHFTQNYAFSPNGKLLYGLRAAGDNLILFSLEIATGKEKMIGNAGRDFAPASNLHPGIRLSITPDGKSITYGAGQFRTNLWMLEGFTK